MRLTTKRLNSRCGLMILKLSCWMGRRMLYDSARGGAAARRAPGYAVVLITAAHSNAFCGSGLTTVCPDITPLVPHSAGYPTTREQAQIHTSAPRQRTWNGQSS